MKQNILLDQVKTYWNKNPCNSDLSEDRLGTKEFFEEQRYKKYFVESHIPKFAEFETWKGKKVLEIGCGIGADTLEFARRGAWVTAVDLTPRALELTKKRLEIYGLSERVQLYEANAEELSSVLPVRNYDLIYSFGVIHHSPNPEKIIEQMRLFADENTVIKIMVYYLWSINFLYRIKKDYKNAIAWILKKDHVALESESQEGCPVVYVYSKRRFCRILRKYGFEPVNSDIAFLMDYEYVPVKLRGLLQSIPKFIIVLLERYFGWNLCVTARLSS